MSENDTVTALAARREIEAAGKSFYEFTDEHGWWPEYTGGEVLDFIEMR